MMKLTLVLHIKLLKFACLLCDALGMGLLIMMHLEIKTLGANLTPLTLGAII
jgi:hypothetical protein